MASGYALPTSGGSSHTHSHSFSGVQHLSPGKPTSNSFSNSNSHPLRQATSHSPLFTHAESSREASPVFFPNGFQSPYKQNPSFEQNVQAFQENGRLSTHKYSHSSPVMKSRPRAESDLGRPTDSRGSTYQPAINSIPTALTSWFSLPEALTSLLVTVPYLFASAAYSSTSGLPMQHFPPLSAYSPLIQSELSEAMDTDTEPYFRRGAFVIAGILTAGTLLIVGMVGKLQASERAIDRAKGRPRLAVDRQALISKSGLQSMMLRALSLGLPLYAAMLLGGTRTALVLVVAIAANLVCSDTSEGPLLEQWRNLWASKVATSVVILLSFIADEIGLTIHVSLMDLILGYLALAVSVLILPPPLPSVNLASPRKARSTSIPLQSNAIPRPWSSSGNSHIASPLISSPIDIDITLISGTLCTILIILASTLMSTSPALSPTTLILITLSIASMSGATLMSQPSTLRSPSKAGLALGCLLTASCSFLFSPSLWPGTVCNGGLGALSFLGVLYDTEKESASVNSHDVHDHVQHTHTHQHQHHKGGESSAFTKLILARCEPGSLVHTILSDKDSRRIAYFTFLNFGFMLVQGAYGYISGSLGLLSDTVHMLFDCLGLIVGLGAAVASKWPTSPENPYGWGKLNTLAGFGNGIFLMLVSIEFVWEAIEGLVEGRELRHVEELLVVSTLGLLVNMVGLFAFGHAHAGHDHGHGHSHAHSDPHSHPHSDSHSHEHKTDHSRLNGHTHNHSCDHQHSHSHSPKSHSSHTAHHHEHNENMHGIFLHVAADAGGSLAVIISTALTLWKPWYLWDPIATIIIAILIFAAAVPLVTSSGQKLLLVVPDELEYGIKEALQDLTDLRGVVGYAVPRFWVDDRDEGRKRVMGVVHVIAAPTADCDETRERVEAFVAERNMNIIIHVEREAEGMCWCGGGVPHSG